MADIKISELSQAESLSLSDLMESAIPYNGGFQSRRMTLAQLSNYLENSVLHTALSTTAKTIIGAINEIVLDLANYYTTSQTYSKTEVDTLIAGVSGLHFLVVQTLPVSDIDPNTIYLVPKQDVGTQDIYDEFIYIVEEAPTPSHWEKIGTTEIDLSDYVTDTELATILNDYVTTSGLNTILANYATTSAMTTALADKVDKVQGKGLSTEDYTTVEKAKLNGIEPSAQVNVQADWTETDSSSDAYIWNKPNVNNVSIAQGTDFGGVLKPIAFTEFYSPTNENTYNHGIFRATDIWKNSNVKGTTSVIGQAHLYAGNWLTNGQEYNAKGYIGVYDESDHTAEMTVNGTLTASRTYYLPDKDGTLALVSDLPTNPVLWSEQNVLGAKNLITFPYYHGFNRTSNNVVFTVDDDGIITVGGTQASANASFYLMYNVKLPNGTYTLSDGGVGTTDTYLSCVYYTTPSASAQYYDVANNGSVTFTVNNWDRATIRIWSRNGKTAANLVFKPMLRLSTISDDTFEPYAETNRQLTLNKVDWNTENILGAKNFCPYKTYNPSGYVNNGITFTVTEEGFVVANGTKVTPTSNAVFNLSERRENNGLFLPNGTYVLTGCPSGGSATTHQVGVAYLNNNNQYTDYGYDNGDGLEFTVNGSYYSNNGAWVRLFWVFRSGQSSADNLTLKPMIRLKQIKNDTYEPQASTNRKLTTDLQNALDMIATTEPSTSASKAYAVGDYMIWQGKFYKVTTAISSGGTINASKLSETTLGAELKSALS